MIKDVIIKQLKQFPDERGKVMHMLKATDDVFEKFGEIYFSTCNPGYIKAWKMHKKKTAFYCVISGNAKIVLCDMRDGQPGKIEEIEVGEQNYVLVKIPPGVAHGFSCIGERLAMIANLTTEAYDPADNFDLKPSEIDYRW